MYIDPTLTKKELQKIYEIDELWNFYSNIRQTNISNNRYLVSIQNRIYNEYEVLIYIFKDSKLLLKNIREICDLFEEIKKYSIKQEQLLTHIGIQVHNALITIRRANDYIQKQIQKRRKGRVILFISLSSTILVITLSSILIAVLSSDLIATGGDVDA